MTDEKSTDASSWLAALKLSEKDQKTWITRGRKIVERYRDERKVRGGKKYNILWSNVRTIFPAVYAKKPKAQVERRYKDADPVARCASEILERALQYEIDHCPDYDSALRGVVLDRLLPGRGVAWVRFEGGPKDEPEIGSDESKESDIENSAEDQPGQVTDNDSVSITDDAEAPQQYDDEYSPVDYIYWEDFRCSPARTWEEVTWGAKRVYMSKDEVIKRFGPEFKDIPLSHEPIGLDDLKNDIGSSSSLDSMKKAKVWEIWDKTDKQAIWVAEGYSKILDQRDDPLELDQFFPFPKPIFATTTTDTIIPVADFVLYQDQASELDELTERIYKLVQACKVVGVYDASQAGIQRMLNEGVDNVMIPVETWAVFSEKGGIKGTMDFLPLDMVIKALQELYAAREACKQVIYDVTGLADILRGSSNPNETLGAQQIKANFGSMRLKETIGDVARFASDLLNIKAQIMCSAYRPETLISMSGIQGTDDAQYVQAAIQLLQSEPIRNYRIEIATDSMVELDEGAEKQARIEFLTATSQFLEKAIQGAKEVPEMAPLLGEMLMFGVRAFKAGRPIEAAYEQMVQKMSQPQPPKPDPAQMQMQMDNQLAQQKMQQEGQLQQMKIQADTQAQAARAQSDMAVEQQKMQLNIQLEEAKMRMQNDFDTKKAMMDQEFQRWKAELDASTKLLVAQVMATKAADENVAPAAEAEFNSSMGK